MCGKPVQLVGWVSFALVSIDPDLGRWRDRSGRYLGLSDGIVVYFNLYFLIYFR